MSDRGRELLRWLLASAIMLFIVKPLVNLLIP